MSRGSQIDVAYELNCTRLIARDLLTTAARLTQHPDRLDTTPVTSSEQKAELTIHGKTLERERPHDVVPSGGTIPGLETPADLEKQRRYDEILFSECDKYCAEMRNSLDKLRKVSNEKLKPMSWTRNFIKHAFAPLVLLNVAGTAASYKYDNPWPVASTALMSLPVSWHLMQGQVQDTSSKMGAVDLVIAMMESNFLALERQIKNRHVPSKEMLAAFSAAIPEDPWTVVGVKSH